MPSHPYLSLLLKSILGIDLDASDNDEQPRKKTKSRPSTVHSDIDANRDQPWPSNDAADTQAAATANPEPIDEEGLLKDLESVNEVQ